MDETEDSIDIKVNYKRKVNYEHLAECSISMNIMSKDKIGRASCRERV